MPIVNGLQKQIQAHRKQRMASSHIALLFKALYRPSLMQEQVNSQECHAGEE